SAVEFSPDGKLLASAAHSGNVIVWDPRTRHAVEGPFQLNIGSIDDMTFSPDGMTIFASGSDGQIAKIALKAAPLRRELSTDTYGSDLKYNAETGMLVSTNDMGDLTFWDPTTLKPIKQIPLSRSEKSGVFALSRDGKSLASVSVKGRLTLW